MKASIECLALTQKQSFYHDPCNVFSLSQFIVSFQHSRPVRAKAVRVKTKSTRRVVHRPSRKAAAVAARGMQGKGWGHQHHHPRRHRLRWQGRRGRGRGRPKIGSAAAMTAIGAMRRSLSARSRATLISCSRRCRTRWQRRGRAKEEAGKSRGGALRVLIGGEEDSTVAAGMAITTIKLGARRADRLLCKIVRRASTSSKTSR